MMKLRQMTWAGAAVLGVAVGFGLFGLFGMEASDLWLGTLATLLVLLVEGE
jgi:hypothetical protein